MALEFVVSRPVRDAGAETFCPTDGAAAERIFTAPEMNMNRPPAASARRRRPAASRTHGHSHGPGTGHHTH